MRQRDASEECRSSPGDISKAEKPEETHELCTELLSNVEWLDIKTERKVKTDLQRSDWVPKRLVSVIYWARKQEWGVREKYHEFILNLLSLKS